MVIHTIAALIVAANVQAAVQDTAATRNGSVRGAVVAADTGVPIRGVRVMLGQAPPEPQDTVAAGPVTLRGYTMTTDGRGSFRFRDVPAGRYRLHVMAMDLTPPFLNDTTAVIFEVRAGRSFDAGAFRLRRGGAITGRVTDARGAPVTNITVSAARMSSTALPGTRRSISQPTDDRGYFRVYGLEDGEYVVIAEPGRQRDPDSGESHESPRGEELVPTLYPSTTELADARRVNVRSGEEVRGIEIRLLEGRLLRLAGTLVDSEGAAVPRAIGYLVYSAHRVTGTPGIGFTTDDSGRFDVPALWPGNYRLSVRRFPDYSADPATRKPAEAANVPLTLSDADVESLIVRTARGGTIEGRMEFEPAPPDNLSNVRVSVMPGPDPACDSTPAAALVQPAFTFEIKDLFCAYLVRALVPGFALKSVLVGGRDVTDTPYRFAFGDRATVVLTSRTSTLEGLVSGDDDKPAAQCGVLAFSQDSGGWIGSGSSVRRGTVDGSGRFRIANLLPGRYFVVAAPPARLAVRPEADGSFFESLSRIATSVAIGEVERRTVDLRCVRD